MSLMVLCKHLTPYVCDPVCLLRVCCVCCSYVCRMFVCLRKFHWGRHFWARGYFCVTAGELTKQMIEDYLSHHFEEKPNANFEIE